MILGIEHRVAQHVAARAGDVVLGRRAVELVALLRAQLRGVHDELLDRDFHLAPRLLELRAHEHLPGALTDRNPGTVTEALRDRALALVDEPVDFGVGDVYLVELGFLRRLHLGGLREREAGSQRNGNGADPLDTHSLSPTPASSP